MQSVWKKTLIRARLISPYFPLPATENVCASLWPLLFSLSGGASFLEVQLLPLSSYFHSLSSGNGLVSYYIDIVLKGVGITDTKTKSIINGSLQVFNFLIAMGAASLIDFAGRRPLFIISNSGMLVSTYTVLIYYELQFY